MQWKKLQHLCLNKCTMRCTSNTSLGSTQEKKSGRLDIRSPIHHRLDQQLLHGQGSTFLVSVPTTWLYVTLHIGHHLYHCRLCWLITVMTILLDLPSNGDRNLVRCATKPCSMLLSFMSLSPPPSPPLVHHTLPGRDFSSHVIKTLSLSPLTAHWRVQTLRNAYPKHYSPLNLASHTVLLLLPYQVRTSSLSYFDTLNPRLEFWIPSFILIFLKLKCSVRKG